MNHFPCSVECLFSCLLELSSRLFHALEFLAVFVNTVPLSHHLDPDSVGLLHLFAWEL